VPKDIKKVVANEKWQKLRKELKGNWKNNVAGNIRKLRQYLGSNPSRDKLRRAKNLIDAVKRGGISSPAINRFQTTLRNKLQK
jgi:hypothetical protein